MKMVKRGPNKVRCHSVRDPVPNLSKFFAVADTFLRADRSKYWFRGVDSLSRGLVPSALRYETKADRDKALGLLSEFRRQVITRLDGDERPEPGDDFAWMQVAQHYGLPTRLLDWTENPTIALYFACQKAKHDLRQDGGVFVLDPALLNETQVRQAAPMDPVNDAAKLAVYAKLDGAESGSGARTVAVSPLVITRRIQLQKGAFTLHGSRRFALDDGQAPGLACILVDDGDKATLLKQLAGIGVEEMSIFPEPEHVCNYLKRAAGLERED